MEQVVSSFWTFNNSVYDPEMHEDMPNLLQLYRVYPSRDWVESQIPEIVKMGIVSLRDDTSDGDEMDVEALVQAYVNIVAGACISLGNCPCIRLTQFSKPLISVIYNKQL